MKTDNFMNTLQSNSLNPDVINPDGKIHRFKTDGKDLSGWYVCFMSADSLGCSYGDWRTGLNETYTEFNNNITVTEKKELIKKINEASEKALHERKELNKEAEERALWIWGNSAVILEHEYLKNKQVKNHGIRLYKSNLVIPIKSTDKKIKSLQFIDESGGKKFLSNGVIKGNAFVLKGELDLIYICEGYSTGATITEVTKKMVVCAFNSGNLPHVSEKVRAAFPNTKIIIACDNDRFNKINVGVLKAEQAAKLINAQIVKPVFKNNIEKLTDFNDLFSSEGSNVAFEQLSGVDKGLFYEVKKMVQSTSGLIKLTDLNNHFNFRNKLEKNNMLNVIELLCKKNILKKDRTKPFLYKVIESGEDIFKLDKKVVFFNACLPFNLDTFVDIPEKSIIIIAGETNGGKTACLLDCLNRNIISKTNKKMTYFSSEMSSGELLSRLDIINPNRNHWKKVSFINRAMDFDDLITGERKDGINFIDYLEPLGENGFAEFDKIITNIRDSLNRGIAFINLQKKTGQEFARGGEATNAKARLSINLSKAYKCATGNPVNICEIKKNKINKKEMINIEDRKCFYIPSGLGISILSEWQYMSKENEKDFIKELQEEFPSAETSKDTLRLL